jgi:branched-chain amino acid aminotransferase
MQYFNFNGKIFNADDKIIGPANRGLRYGDGLFETIKMKNSKLILSDEHFARLWKGMQLMQFEIPKLLTPEKLQDQINLLAKKNKITNARIRLNIIRNDGGLYDPKTHIPDYIIEMVSLSEDTYRLNNNGLELCIYDAAYKSADTFSNLKHNNFLPYLMGALYAKNNRFNDAIILNEKGNICDTTIANLFIIKNGNVCTPSLSQGCVAGVMRKWIVDYLKNNDCVISETVISKEMVLEADEVFLTNSVYNLRWVSSLQNKSYSNNLIQHLTNKISKDFPEIFC